MAKPKIAFYWAASCGGCEISVTELGMELAAIADLVDIVFWPCIMDFKYSDVEAMADGEILISLFNGAIRTDENLHIARLLRQKSQLLVAFGACAQMGGIPGLANSFDKESILARVYDTIPSNEERTRGVRPQVSTKMPEGEIALPSFHAYVKTLAQTVPVDYFMPGCPPVVDQIRIVLHALLAGELPPVGSVIGADPKTACAVCSRKKSPNGVRIRTFYRPHEIEIDREICFLEQGLICCGPATRAGCGLPCIGGNMPCRGCYGPPDGVEDQGAKLLSAIAAIIDADTAEELQAVMDTIVDPVGTYFRFGLSASILSELKYG